MKGYGTIRLVITKKNLKYTPLEPSKSRAMKVATFLIKNPHALEELPEHAYTDETIFGAVLEVLQKAPETYSCLPPIYRGCIKVYRAMKNVNALTTDIMKETIQYSFIECKNNTELQGYLVAQIEFAITPMSEALSDDHYQILSEISRLDTIAGFRLCKWFVIDNPSALGYLNRNFFLNPLAEDIICEILRKNPESMRSIPKEFLTKRVCILGLRSLSALSYVPFEMYEDVDVMERIDKSVELFSINIGDVHPEFFEKYPKRGRELCRIAVSSNGYAYLFIPDQYKSDASLVALAVENNTSMLSKIDWKLFSNKDIELILNSINTFMMVNDLSHLPDDIKKKYHSMLITKRGGLFNRSLKVAPIEG